MAQITPPIADRRRTSPDQKLGVALLAEEPSSRISDSFSHLIPRDLAPADRQKFEVGLMIGTQILSLTEQDLAQKIERLRADLDKSHGRDHPALGHILANRFFREQRGEAVEHAGELRPSDNDAARKFGAAVNIATRQLGWSRSAISESLVDLTVRFSGDKDKAAAVFVDLITAERRQESGHAKNSAIDNERGNDRPHPLYESTVDPTVDTHNDRLARENVADAKLAQIDRVAASILDDREYAAYRITRDNPHLIHFSRAEMSHDSNDRESTIAKKIALDLNINPSHGREIYNATLDKMKSAPKLADKISLSHDDQIEDRMSRSTNSIVAESRSRRDPDELAAQAERERERARGRAAASRARKKAIANGQDVGIGF
jgi:hypothetical protein